MIKLRPKIFSRSNSKVGGGGVGGGGSPATAMGGGEIKWELRPGGMLVQKRENKENGGEETMITIRVSTVSKWHDISVQPTSTFGNTSTSYIHSQLINFIIHHIKYIKLNSKITKFLCI